MTRKRFYKIVFGITGSLIGVLLVAAILLFKPVDREYYKNMPYYLRMRALLDSLPASASADSTPLKAGWAKISIVPSGSMPLAGYGLRSAFNKVHDSIWCRTFIMENGKERFALVCLDLMIFPPAVVQALKPMLPSLNISEKNLYLTASHTHHAPGGWAHGLGGRLLAGGYDEAYVKQLADAVAESIRRAQAGVLPASIGFSKVEERKILNNRLSKNPEDTDAWVRIIKIKKEDGAQAVIVSYAAHPTNLEAKLSDVSGDYAGALVDSLEHHKGINFAAFFAGAVAGHTCEGLKLKNYPLIAYLTSNILNKIKPVVDSMPVRDSLVQMASMKVPVYLRDPQIKISRDWRLRPWLMRPLFGDQEVYISAMRIGNIVLVGTPCDFAGELMKDFSAQCNKKKIDLIVTSFNGGYVGYILPDKYYDLSAREPRDMDWYGPYSGSYFVEIIRAILEKI